MFPIEKYKLTVISYYDNRLHSVVKIKFVCPIALDFEKVMQDLYLIFLFHKYVHSKSDTNSLQTILREYKQKDLSKLQNFLGFLWKNQFNLEKLGIYHLKDDNVQKFCPFDLSFEYMQKTDEKITNIQNDNFLTYLSDFDICSKFKDKTGTIWQYESNQSKFKESKISDFFEE